MTDSDFLFKDKFPSLYTAGHSAKVTEAIAEITVLFAGVATLWATVASRVKKRTLCYNYLVAWYLADLYPDSSEGVMGSGGMPLTSKSIGGVSITFKDMETQGAMKALESNTFGQKAWMMISAAPERYRIYP